LEKEGALSISGFDKKPSLTKNSGLIRRGLPAKADRVLYGEFPWARLVGLNGRICQKLCPVSERKSANR
jgi:hypothetical protein